MLMRIFPLKMFCGTDFYYKSPVAIPNSNAIFQYDHVSNNKKSQWVKCAVVPPTLIIYLQRASYTGSKQQSFF